MTPKALSGLRVLDLATLYAAPLIATFLGDLGADVVHVEGPGGDPIRQLGASRDGIPTLWSYVGRNKRSVVVDPSTTEGLDLLRRLTTKADVVVANQPPSVLGTWNCRYAQIADRNPRAVVVLVSAYGQDGPYADRPGNGTLAEAFGGLTTMIGEPEGPPMLPSVPLGDTLAAWSGALSAVAACYWRDCNGGRGQLIDVALFDPVLSLLAPSMVAWDPGEPAPTRTGSRVPGGDPRNCYETRDHRFVVLSGPTDRQVRRILDVLELSDDDARVRFVSADQRLVHGDELDAAVASWIRERPLVEVVAAFEGARIPITPVHDLGDLIAHPQILHRGGIVEVDRAEGGRVCMPMALPRFAATPAHVGASGPALGAHTDEVIEDWLDADGDPHRPLTEGTDVRRRRA